MVPEFSILNNKFAVAGFVFFGYSGAVYKISNTALLLFVSCKTTAKLLSSLYSLTASMFIARFWTCEPVKEMSAALSWFALMLSGVALAGCTTVKEALFKSRYFLAAFDMSCGVISLTIFSKSVSRFRSLSWKAPPTSAFV